MSENNTITNEQIKDVYQKLKKVITNFKDKWNNTNGLWKNEFFEGLKYYKNLKINASYGMGNRLILPKTPYMNFLKEGFTTNKGVYPYISYLYNENKFEVGIAISRDHNPDLNDLIITEINEYEKKDFNTDDLDSVIKQLDICIADFLNILDSNYDNKQQLNNNKAIKMNVKNIILYGAPGVGKTHNTNKLINLIDESKSEKEIFNAIKENKNETITLNDDLKSRVKFITFHQSFGYEDFIEGFRPNKEGNIKIEKGIFHNICTEAIKEENKDTNYYLVIDEINRGNISKIFGELITLIEEDKRDKIEVTLPYSKETFKVPSNLFIIGTMNSTDKSIALIDIALRRRFTFLKMKPNEILVPDIAKSIFSQINQKISETIGEDYKIGHSYFMNISNEDDLNFVLEYKITPLLEEYFYGNKEQLDQVLEIIKG